MANQVEKNKEEKHKVEKLSGHIKKQQHVAG